MELDATQASQPLSDKPSSQKKSQSSQPNLSIHCKEEEVSSSDEEEQSIMMTQQVFYDADSEKVKLEQVQSPKALDYNQDGEKQLEYNEPDKKENEEFEKGSVSDGDFDDFSTSQLLQIDGNNDAEKVISRKKKRLGGRPSKDAMLPSSSSTSTVGRILRSSKGIGKDLFQQPSVSVEKCTRVPQLNKAQQNNKLKSPCNKNLALSPSSENAKNLNLSVLKRKGLYHQNADINGATNRPYKSSEFKFGGKSGKEIAVPSRSTQNSDSAAAISPKHITKVSLTQNSPSLDFNLSQFDDLKFSPTSTKEKKYRKLKISSPISKNSSQPRKSLSLKRNRKNTNRDVKKLQTTPVKERILPKTDKDTFVPKKLFPIKPNVEVSPKTKLINVLDAMINEDKFSIKSFQTGSSKSIHSSCSSDTYEDTNQNAPISSRIKPSSQDMKIIEKEEMQLDNKVLMWLSESECSQDESELVNKSSGLQINESKTESVTLSLEFSKDSFSYSPASPKRSRKVSLSSSKSVSLFESNPDNPSNAVIQISADDNEHNADNVTQCGNLAIRSQDSSVADPNKVNSSQATSSKSSKLSLNSPDILSDSIDASKLSVTSPVILSSPSNNSKTSSGSYLESHMPASTPTIICSPESNEIEFDDASNSIFSTPNKIEFNTSLFYSQYQLDDEQKIHENDSIQTFRYNKVQPTVTDCLNFVQQNYTDGDVSTMIQPHYSTAEDVPGPSTVGSRKIHFEHTNSLPEQVFFPECETDLGILGLESWEEILSKHCNKSKENTISVKYSFQAPFVSDVREWLSRKKKKASSESESLSSSSGTQNKTETESLPAALCSTPKSTKVNFCSLPDKFITPILKNPISKFKKKVKFSPKNDSLNAPISPTLFINSHISEQSCNDSYKFGMTVPMGDCTKSHVVQHLTVLSLEMFASTVGDKKPNPRYDPVIAVFYALYSDNNQDIVEGSVCINPQNLKPKCIPQGMLFVDSEGDLFKEIFRVVDEHDPDIITGYEIKMSSLGYLIERANNIGLNFQANISRFPEETKDISDEPEGVSNWWVTVTNEVQLAGRVIINLWRLMRTEVTLTNYSFESVAYHVLHERLPKHPQPTLFNFYKDAKLFFNFVDYFIIRARGNLRLLLDLNILVRTSEMGRLFGIEFFNVLSRGSQYRVESMMSRLAKPLKFISISPSPDQRMSMAAPEFIPLVMEPESKFYGDPVVVLDFQSLYPTMIIAYNMCFSTCLGRVNYLGTYGSFPFGAATLNVTPNCLKKYKDHMFVSPCGVAFVNQSVRKGVLPMMLNEILETRIMVKQMMKQHKDDKALYKMLDARQMALKLIANVTYGYTSANFSGRMPCIEIGDSIVAKGRETLESAIELVNNTPKWGGRVVYGDTDSLFILFKGCSKEDAFKRGHEIAELVTELNPKPVKLKFEKVYYPCVLQTKKRYVGMKYESPDDPGEYEAKGIETVRRDGCPASVKTLKQALHILFKTRDLSNIKTFLQNQFMKIAKNQISVQDFIFAKEYRGRDSYRQGASVPALEIAKKRLKNDPRSEPLVGERVQYVICYGTPGLPLIQLVHEPAQLLFSNNFYLNSIYYITKAIIPPLQRVFGLMGVNVLAWYNELPKDLRMHFVPTNTRSKHTLSHYYHTKHCPFCDKVSDSLCVCYQDQQKVGVLIHSELSLISDRLHSLYSICTDCTNTPSIVANPGTPHNRNCVNFTCPVMFKRIKLCNRISEKENTKNEVYKLYDW